MTARRNLVLGLAAVASLAVLAACDQGMMTSKMHYTANLSAASEVPPVASSGQGTADIWYDQGTRTLSWTLTYSGLSGPATAAHFHGPAGPGANAGVMVPIAGAGMASPVTGSAVLDDTKAGQLAAGQWYVNIHTDRNKGGEIRGQVVPVK